jgi:lipoprotein-anchoring transpeptidase ErfK/SrfK
MKAIKLNRLAMMVGTAAILAVQALGQSAAVQAPPDAVKRVIVVSLEDRKLALVEDGQVKKVYPVAVGKPSTPSPVGTFIIERRVVNPTYHHNGRTVLPGPGNPVGTRWMGLSKHGYGIHGTNEPKSIGKAASHGCIRMARANLEEFYELVAEGDTVELVGQRNDQTAQLFGSAPLPAAQPAMTVAAAIAQPAPASIASIETASTEKTVDPAIAAAGRR